MGAYLLLLFAAVAEGPDAAVMDVEPKVFAAAQALGPEVALFTSRARPLRSLRELRAPAAEIGAGEVTGAREVLAFLRAGGVPVSGGAADIMALAAPPHWPALFRARPQLRLFVVRARADGREQEIASRGGGVRLVLRSGDQTFGATAARTATSGALDAAGWPATSFGPLRGAERGPTARDRIFDAREGVRQEVRTARSGHVFVTVHLDRDFSAGVGVVSFLYGSGIIVKPDFTALKVRDAAGALYPLAATRAEGRTVDLAYQVPVGANGLSLQDGEAIIPLEPLLSRPTTD